MSEKLTRAQRSAINKRAMALANRLQAIAYWAYRIRLTEQARIDPDSIDVAADAPGNRPDISDLLELP